MQLKKEIIDRVRLVIGKIEFYLMKNHILKSGGVGKHNINPDKVFYIISGTHLKMRGLFGDINVIYRYCNYAIEKGYIPVIDFKHVPNNMISDKDVGKINGWETLFEQPTKYSLEEALASKNRIVIDCHGNGSLQCKEREEVPWDIDWNDEKSIDYWTKVIGLIRIKPEIMQDIERSFNNIFSSDDRILGVKIRGTDYVANKPYGHPVQPEVEDVIIKTREIKDVYKCNKIFLSCEDKTVKEKFKDEFGEVLVTGNVAYSVNNKEYLYDFYEKNNIDPLENNMEYLTNTIFLTKCNCLISSQNSATNAIRLWGRKNGGYEYEYIYDLGCYGIN